MEYQCLIDANVIIDYTSGRFNQQGNLFLENFFNSDFNTSVVVKIEVLGYNDIPSKMELLAEFLNTANIYPLDDAITK